MDIQNTSESKIEKKLLSLDKSANSITNLSAWALKNKVHHHKLVKIWLKVIEKANPAKRLLLMYMCNDVLQNCAKRQATEYRDSFYKVLESAFSHCKNDGENRQRLARMLDIWESRNVYSSIFVNKLKDCMSCAPTPPNAVVIESLDFTDNMPTSPWSPTNRPSNRCKISLSVEEKEARERDESLLKIPDPAPSSQFDLGSFTKRMADLCSAENTLEEKVKNIKESRFSQFSVERVLATKDRTTCAHLGESFSSGRTELEECVGGMRLRIALRRKVIQNARQAVDFYSALLGDVIDVQKVFQSFGKKVSKMYAKTSDKSGTRSPPPSPPSFDALVPSPIDSPMQMYAVDPTSDVQSSTSSLFSRLNESGGTPVLDEPSEPSSVVLLRETDTSTPTKSIPNSHLEGAVESPFTILSKVLNKMSTKVEKSDAPLSFLSSLIPVKPPAPPPPDLHARFCRDKELPMSSSTTNELRHNSISKNSLNPLGQSFPAENVRSNSNWEKSWDEHNVVQRNDQQGRNCTLTSAVTSHSPVKFPLLSSPNSTLPLLSPARNFNYQTSLMNSETKRPINSLNSDQFSHDFSASRIGDGGVSNCTVVFSNSSLTSLQQIHKSSPLLQCPPSQQPLLPTPNMYDVTPITSPVSVSSKPRFSMFHNSLHVSPTTDSAQFQFPFSTNPTPSPPPAMSKGMTCPGILETPTGILETPTGNLETPTGILETPTGILETPTGILETPTGILETPTGILETPTGVLETPTGILNTPTCIFDASIEQPFQNDASPGGNVTCSALLETPTKISVVSSYKGSSDLIQRLSDTVVSQGEELGEQLKSSNDDSLLSSNWTGDFLYGDEKSVERKYNSSFGSGIRHKGHQRFQSPDFRESQQNSPCLAGPRRVIPSELSSHASHNFTSPFRREVLASKSVRKDSFPHVLSQLPFQRDPTHGPVFRAYPPRHPRPY